MRRGDARWVGLVLAFLVCTPAPGSSQITPLRQLSAVLPAGEGKILVLKYCVACHGPALAEKRLEAGRGWPRNYWEDLIAQMIQAWGATIETTEVPTIVSYLETTYAAASSTLQLTWEGLPAGKEKDLFEMKCFVCHSKEVTARRVAGRRGLRQAAWTRLLHRMGSYGAPLSEMEVSQLSGYLERVMVSRENTADQRALTAFSSALPDREGKDVVLAVCLSCHGADDLGTRIEAAPTDDAFYWERVVKRMESRWEAPLDEQQVDTTIKYLSSLTSK